VYQEVRDTPGTEVVTFSRAIGLELDGERYPVVGVEPAAFARVFDITMAHGAYTDLSLGGALIDEQTAARAGLRVGDTADVTFANGPGRLRIDGIYQASGAAQGFLVSLPTLAAAGSLERDTAVYVRLAPGSSPDDVRAELERRVASTPSIQVVDRTQLKDQIDSQFNRVFGFVYTLLALAVIVAFLGIVNTLALSVHERRREVGLLRAVGTSRRQIRSMVILESVLIAFLGGVVGIAIGVAYGALLQKALSSQGVSTLAVPYGQLGWFVLAAVVGGFIAALWPASTAARMNVLRAIASE
jgi:putative ABC transport system permease protein